MVYSLGEIFNCEHFFLATLHCTLPLTADLLVLPNHCSGQKLQLILPWPAVSWRFSATWLAVAQIPREEDSEPCMLDIILLVVRLEDEPSKAELGGRAGWGLLCLANRAMSSNVLALCC